MVTKIFFAITVLAAGVIGQGVYEAIPPKGSSPPGCVNTMSGEFELSIDPIAGSSSKSKSRRAIINPDDPYVGQRKTLKVTLSNGILKDATGATGYIADNRQFQFDNPPQTGAIYTSGFSFCKNGTLALGPSTVWVQCLSGSFYNLYDVNPAGQCQDVNIGVHSTSAAASPVPSALDQTIESKTQDLPNTSTRVIKATGIITSDMISPTVAKLNTSSPSTDTIISSATPKTSLLAANLTSSNMTLANKATPTQSLSTSSQSTPTSASTSAVKSSGLGLAYLPMSVVMNIALVAGVLAI